MSLLSDCSIVLTSSVCLTLGTLFYLCYICYVYPYFLSPLRKVPTAPGAWFVLGHLPSIFQVEYGLRQRQWHMQLQSPIVRFMGLFGEERVSCVDEASIREITVLDPYNYVRPRRITNWMASMLGRGVLVVDGEEHKRQRKAIAPAFSISAIRALQPVIWDKSLHLLELWHGQSRHKDAPMGIEILNWLNRTTLDIIGASAFGDDINAMDNPSNETGEAYSNFFKFDRWSNVFHVFMLYSMKILWVPCQPCRNYKRSCNLIREHANSVIESKSRPLQANGKDILSLIVRDNEKRKRDGAEDALTFEALRDQVMTFTGAGHETTASHVGWTLYLVAKHPEVQEKLRAEIFDMLPKLRLLAAADAHDVFALRQQASVAEDARIVMGDVDVLPYLDKVCKESARFIPVVPGVMRVNLQPSTLCGFYVPAGTEVAIVANATNHLPQYWGETADTFDPDRWDHLPEQWTQSAFMTFLQGPRGCVGRKFSETEAKILLCVLLAGFRFDLDPAWPSPEEAKQWRLVLRPRDGMHLMVQRLSG